MQLLCAGPSPFVRKVRVLLEETGQTAAVKMVSVTASPMEADPTLISANPLGKIPALVRDDGPTLYDSRVICRYLDDHAGAGMYPAKRLWDVLTLEATADAMMEAAVLCVYEARFRPETLRSHDWIEAQWTKIARALDALESRWMAHLAGPLDMSQIAIGCALGYLDFRHEARGWRKSHDQLDDWFAAFSQRPAMLATRPDA